MMERIIASPLIKTEPEMLSFSVGRLGAMDHRWFKDTDSELAAAKRLVVCVTALPFLIALGLMVVWVWITYF